MSLVMKKIILALSLITFSVFSSAATIFQRSDFGPNAVNYGFDNAAVGDTTAGDNNLTFSGIASGLVDDAAQINFNNQGFTGPLGYRTVVGGFQSGFNFQFNTPVSAVGFNFAVGAIDITEVQFSIRDINNQTIEFIPILGSDLDICTGTNLVNYRCGYIGLDAGSNIIARAELVPRFNVVTSFFWNADNIIYQKVSAPNVLWLIALGLPGIFLNRTKKITS